MSSAAAHGAAVQQLFTRVQARGKRTVLKTTALHMDITIARL